MRGWLRLHVSNICNFNCPHCHVFKGPENSLPAKIMSPLTMESALDSYVQVLESFKVPDLTVSLYGGEPLLAKKNFLPFMQKIGDSYRGKSIRWLINSNGSMLTSEDVEIFKRFRNLEFHLSIDGPRDVQNKSRPDKAGRDSFDYVLNALSLLKDSGIKTQINSYVMPENQGHLNFLVDLATQYNVPTLYMDVMHFQDHTISTKTIEAYKEFFAYGVSKGKRIIGPWVSVNYDGVHDAHVENKILGLEVQLDGTVYRTVYPLSKKMPFRLEQISEVMGKDKIRKDREVYAQYFGDQCGTCPAYKLCGGGALAQYHYHVSSEQGHHSACDLYREMLTLFQQRFNVVESKKASVYTQCSKVESEKFAVAADRELSSLEQVWGPLKNKPQIFLFKDGNAFKFYAGAYRLPEWVKGLVRGESYMQWGSEVPSVLRHEMTHLFVRQNQKGQLPVWFEEGLCEYFAGAKIREIATSPVNFDDLHRMTVESAFDSDSRRPTDNAFYIQSHQFVSYLVDEKGLHNVLNVIRDEDADFLKKAERHLQEDLPTLFKRWKESA